MADRGTAAAIIEVARKEVGTIEGPKDNAVSYTHLTLPTNREV